MMALGGAVGFAGVGLPFVETGIALSIVVIGGALALGLSLPAIAAMALVGAFAVFHGHAHGAEMPVAASGLAYGLGFLLETALLHGAGLAHGFGLDGQNERSEERTSELQSLMRNSYPAFCLKKKKKRSSLIQQSFDHHTNYLKD